MVLLYILLAVAIVSAISLIGLITFFMKAKTLDKVLFYFVSFATGAMLAGAFFDLIPEAITRWGGVIIPYVLVGIVTFFFVERFLYVYHCHKRNCKVHSYTYMCLLGDSIHNFMDGMLISASFLTAIPLGVVTSLAVIAHEIPHEIGNFGVLVYGGMKRQKALYYNFLTSLAAFVGAILVYILSASIQGVEFFLVPFGAGGFIYLAATDLMPEFHKESDTRHSALQLATLLLGIGIIALAMSLLK